MSLHPSLQDDARTYLVYQSFVLTRLLPQSALQHRLVSQHTGVAFVPHLHRYVWYCFLQLLYKGFHSRQIVTVSFLVPHSLAETSSAFASPQWSDHSLLSAKGPSQQYLCDGPRSLYIGLYSPYIDKVRSIISDTATKRRDTDLPDCCGSEQPLPSCHSWWQSHDTWCLEW